MGGGKLGEAVPLCFRTGAFGVAAAPPFGVAAATVVGDSNFLIMSRTLLAFGVRRPPLADAGEGGGNNGADAVPDARGVVSTPARAPNKVEGDVETAPAPLPDWEARALEDNDGNGPQDTAGRGKASCRPAPLPHGSKRPGLAVRVGAMDSWAAAAAGVLAASEGCDGRLGASAGLELPVEGGGSTGTSASGHWHKRSVSFESCRSSI